MKVVITGGAGFIGSMLAARLLAQGGLKDAQGQAATIDELVVLDLMAPANLPDDKRLKVQVGQATDRALMAQAVEGADTIFHFASVVSGGAEADLQLGLKVNLDGTRMLLDLLADSGTHPKLVFSSSCGVYGGVQTVDDSTTAWPQTSYGVQKLCCELLIGDYHRKGLIDGRSLRFPTIAVRPGKPNLAASSFISNIVREPALGRETVCPVPDDMPIAVMSPRRLVEAIIVAHNLSSDDFGWPRTLVLPAIRVTVAEMLDALEKRLGAEARARVSFSPDELVTRIARGWPEEVVGARAESMGIATNASADEFVDEFVTDHVPPRL